MGVSPSLAMAFRTFFALLLLAVVYVSAENVVVLTDDTFESTIAENDFVLVEFFAPWCGHCKKLAPEFEKAATQLKDSGIVLGSVDATVYGDLAQSHGVKGYPTLFFFKNGQKIDYSGPREAAGIVAWLNKKSGPAVTTVEDVAEFCAGKSVCVAATYPADSDAQKAFHKVAGAHDDIVFAEVLGGDASVTVHRNFDEDVSTTNFDDLDSFLEDNVHPYFASAQQAWARLQAADLTITVVAIDEDTHTEEFALFSKIAKDLNGKIGIVHVPGSFAPKLAQFGVSGDSVPCLAATNAQGEKYPYDGEIAEEPLRAFFGSIIAGTAVPFFKSEPIPETQEGPVTVVVGHSFDDVVVNNDKTVFLKLYAPWCGHCKSLAPIWDELAEAYAEDDDVVIAKIDSTANDNSRVQVSGFPTLVLFKGGDKSNFVKYEGGRTLDELKAFVEQH